MKLNKEAEEKARSMIKSGQYVKESDWSEAQPTTEDENDYLERHSWKDYGEWQLGIHDDSSKQTKSRYGFPYGDFSRVHRSGLVAVKQRAAQQTYTDIEKAADRLLKLLG